MNLKKKLRRFFTLTRTADGGFTLVELIVVIAILGILAGVGTVGYSGYIKNSNKNADKALVGDVIRAVETGIYSFAYPMEEKLQPGKEGVQIPIGFVVLSEDGAEVVETSSEIVTSPAAKCERGSVTVYELEKQVTGSKYFLSSSTISYCKTHSNIPSSESEYNKTTVATLKEAIGVDKIYKNRLAMSAYSDAEKFLMKGTYRLLEYDTEKHNDTIDHGEVTEYVVGNASVDGADSALVKMLIDAFGSEYKEQTKLAYTWNAGAVNSYFSNGQALWGKIETLGDTLINNIDPATGELTLFGFGTGKQLTSKGYSSVDELAVTVGTKFATSFTDAEDFYNRAWKPVDDSDGDDLVEADKADSFYYCSWGFEVGGREFYSTARVGYNEAFANYLRDHLNDYKDEYGDHHASHVTNVQNFGEFMVVATFPQTVCLSAFEKEADPLNDNCEACKKIYKDYVNSGTSKLNALEFYKTMVTINETKGQSTVSPLGVMGYYGNYIEELQSVYAGVSTLAGQKDSVIVIAVYYNNGVVECEVLPMEANPRKSN